MARVFAPTVQYQAPSLDEMLKPLTMYSEAYDKIQKEYDAEEDRAAMLEALAGGNDPNAESYEYMKPYYDLREQVANDMLHNTNLNVRRQRLRDLRNMWRDKGIKAQLGIDAYTKYKDAVNKTPGAIYNSHSLMDFINNPQLQYSVIDPKDIESRGSAIFQTVAKNLPPQYAGTFLNNAMVMLKQGLSAEDIANIDGPNSPYIGIVENLRNLYGETYNNLTPEAQAAYDAAIQRSAYAGMATTKAMENPDISRALQGINLQSARLSLEENKRKAAIERELDSYAYWDNATLQWRTRHGQVVGSDPQKPNQDYVPVNADTMTAITSTDYSKKKNDKFYYTDEMLFGSFDFNSNNFDVGKKETHLPVSGFEVKFGNQTQKFEPQFYYKANGDEVSSSTSSNETKKDKIKNYTGYLVGYDQNRFNFIGKKDSNGNYLTGKNVPLKVAKAIASNQNINTDNSYILKTNPDSKGDIYYIVMTPKFQ